MKLVVDMNLAPEWASALVESGVEAVHWSEVGDPRAADAVIFDWARENDCIVFTHDLDFGAILVATGARGPSVLQLRAQDVTPHAMLRTVVDALITYRAHLESGALLTIDPRRARIRVLPLVR
jgi:predicted nuclease of predicted toxin-antitoxin system